MTTSSRRPLRFGALVAVGAVSLTLAGSPASAYWRAAGSGIGTASTDDMQAGKTPTAVATNQSIQVSWPASTTTAGAAVSGYRIARYATATGGTPTAATGGCAGVVAALSCTEAGVPVGTWHYSVTPVLNSWSGSEGPRSSGATSAAPDTTAPSVTLTSPASGSTVSTTPTFSGAAGTAAGDSATVTVNVYAGSTATGTAVQTLTATASGNTWSATSTAALADGTYTALASQRDAAGNIGRSATSTFTVSTVAPTVTITSPGNGSTVETNKPTYAGTSPTGGSVSVKVYAGTSASGTVLDTLSATAGANGWSVPGATALADGTYTVQATSSDGAGNTGTATSTFTVRTTTVAPAVSVTSPTAGSFVQATPTFTGSASGGTTVAVRVYSGTTATGTPVQVLSATVSGGTWSVPASPALTNGQFTVQAAIGTTLSAPVTFTVDTAAPSVTAVTLSNGVPSVAGTAGAGDTVKITFSEVMDATKFCSTWTNSGVQNLSGAVATLTQNGSTDTIDRVSIATQCGGALNYGTVNTGGDYLTGGSLNWSSSTLSWDPVSRTLTLTLGGTPTDSKGGPPGNNQISANVPAGTPAHTEPTSGLTDLAGNRLAATLFTSTVRSGF